MKWLLAIIGLLLSACDFTVPLSPKPLLPLDQRATGLWERELPEGKIERLLVLPLNDKEYFISWPEGDKTELYAKAHLFDYSGKTLVQLEWFGNSEGTVPDDDDIYQVAKYTIKDNVLEIDMLNPRVVGYDHNTTADLAAALEKNRNNPELFHDKMIYNQVLE